MAAVTAHRMFWHPTTTIYFAYGVRFVLRINRNCLHQNHWSLYYVETFCEVTIDVQNNVYRSFTVQKIKTNHTISPNKLPHWVVRGSNPQARTLVIISDWLSVNKHYFVYIYCCLGADHLQAFINLFLLRRNWIVIFSGLMVTPHDVTSRKVLNLLAVGFLIILDKCWNVISGTEHTSSLWHHRRLHAFKLNGNTRITTEWLARLIRILKVCWWTLCPKTV